ncbi:MAG: phage baseplate assembly protein V [Paracoccus sp. (in: a-proteobacteria)]|uniref:phage baseplate assembly protein V n=1 Tax=Paracoccus sp. TaxID=267 RepID=UPI00391C8ADA
MTRPMILTLDGAPFPAPLVSALSGLSLHQSLGAPAALEIELAFHRPDLPQALRAGVQIGLSVRGAPEPLFSGEVTDIALSYSAGGPPVATITARDGMQALACRQSMLALRDMSAADLAAHLAGELGLDSHCPEDAPVHGLILQQQQTDLDLLADVAAGAGLYPVLRGGTLVLMSLAGDSDDAVALRPDEGLHALRVTSRAGQWLPSVRIAGRDRLTLQNRQAQVATARQDQVEMRDPGPVTGHSPRHLLNHATDSDAGAEALAAASLERALARTVVAEGLAEGDARLIPGRIIRLEGVDAGLGGQYVLTRTTHRLTAAQGYVTEFSTEPPQRPASPAATTTSIGQVLAVDDPARLGRCQVQLADLGLAEGVWMHVVAAGAGPRRGVAALPDPGDQVLVLLPQGDPSFGLVIGGLYGEQALPQRATDTPRGIVLRSGDGQSVHLSGKGGRLHLSNREGSVLDLSPGRMRMAAAGDLLIEAPGRTLTIRAAAINFEKG